MKSIYLLTDYKGQFGSKYNAEPYNSGMSKYLLERYFKEFGYTVEFVPFVNVIDYPIEFWLGKNVLYTSSEDTDYFYKNFIEDVVLFLENIGANIIPKYNLLRANNNKVFMELHSKELSLSRESNDNSQIFGTLEEAILKAKELTYPLVYKQAAGAMSSGVGLIQNESEFKSKLNKISRTKNLFREFWEMGRFLKYKGYKKESKNRKKFILQPFIPNLDGDFKILIFGNNYYVLKRSARVGDFRASGSGIRKFTKDIPEGILQYSKNVFNKLNVPNLSIDIAFDGKEFHLIEFQALYFGSFTLTYSDFCWWFNKTTVQFELVDQKSVLEKEYVNSIIEFIST